MSETTATTYTPKLKRPATRDRLAKKKKPESDVPIVVDHDLVDAYEEANQEYERASLMARTLLAANTLRESPDAVLATEEASRRLADAEAALDTAARGLEDAVVVMRFRSIGNKRFDDLMLQHPPTDEQIGQSKERGEDPPGYDVTTFAPALILASCIQPADLTAADVDEYYNEWNQGDIMQLWLGALTVNQISRTVPDLPKASGLTQG